MALVEMMNELAPRYDLILIDCPPNLYLATWAALAASDALSYPRPARRLRDSRTCLRRTVDQFGPCDHQPPTVHARGPGHDVRGEKMVHLAYEALLRETYKEAVFTTYIPHAIDLPEATMHHTPLSWYKPRSAAAKALATLAIEVSERLEPATRKEVA